MKKISTSNEIINERRIVEVNEDIRKRRQALKLEAQLDEFFEIEMEICKEFPEILESKIQKNKKNPNRGHFSEAEMRALYFGGRENWQPGCQPDRKTRRYCVLPPADRRFRVECIY